MRQRYNSRFYAGANTNSMSTAHNDQSDHSTAIKTPTQLVTVVVLAFVIPIAVIVLIIQFVMGTSTPKSSPAMTDKEIAERIKPMGSVPADAIIDPKAPKVEKTGKAVFDAVCMACHATGALNAPKVGDNAAWAPRIKEGLETISADAIKGIRQMPARGGNPDLTDTEVVRAVVYMANQSGANWKEPESKPVEVAAAPPAPATPAPAAAKAASGDAAKGKSVYDGTCTACHTPGVAGAPKLGDKTAWAPRLKTGMDALYTSALKGKNAMPPKGGNLSLPDADVKAAVDYITSQAK